MFPYLAFKKYKKQKEKKKTTEESKEADSSSSPQPAAETQSPAPETVVLDDSDQEFIERILSEAGDQAPPLPPRVRTPDISWDSASESGAPSPPQEPADDKGEVKPSKDVKARNRLSSLLPWKKPAHLEPTVPITGKEAERESEDLTRVLDKLNMSARDNKAVSLSAETGEVVRKFTQVIKDLMTGVPTAYHDLITLIEDRDGVLARNYEKLPKSLQKLITTLPTKITSTLAPELLAVAAEAQGLGKPEGSAGKDDLKDAAKKFLSPANLTQFVTKPGAIASMLKAIVNALKARFPAFIGTNVIWAVAVSLLMFVLWYCHKRGREVRLEHEKSGEGTDLVDENDRIEELPDDPQPPAATTSPSGNDVPPVTVSEPAN